MLTILGQNIRFGCGASQDGSHSDPHMYGFSFSPHLTFSSLFRASTSVFENINKIAIFFKVEIVQLDFCDR